MSTKTTEKNSEENIRYRPDIDGLRAVAVLIVVFFHYHITAFRGGFVGVDVFFVISGYLISSHILTDLRAGHFSLLRFYERRARRILPALFAVCLTTTAVATLFFFPGDLMELGRSLIATSLFVSNIFFWSVTGYFATTVWEKPLLHGWSLGVEEQFYILYPLLLMALFRWRRGGNAAFAVAIAALLSFAASLYAIYHAPNAAFYLIPFRFWELAVGGLLASLPAITLKRGWMYDFLTLAGLAAIVLAALTFSKHGLFPGWLALAPCLGAALVIFAGARARIGGWALRTRPMNFTGRLSYSLYLWHWPMQACVQYRFADAMISGGWHPWAWRGGAFAVAYMLAFLSWRYIEQPFRRTDRFSRRQVFSWAALSIAILSGTGFILIAGAGFPARLPSAALAVAAAADDRAFPPFHGCLSAADPNRATPSCLIGDSNAPVTAAVWGDSHAGAFKPALDQVLRDHGLRAILFLQSSCPPFSGPFQEGNPEFRGCPSFDAAVAGYLRRRPEIKYIFLGARWASHADDIQFAGERADAFYETLGATVDTLRSQDRDVFLIGPVPEPGFDVPRCLSRQMAYGPAFFPCVPATRSGFLGRQHTVDSALARLSSRASLFQPGDRLCAGLSCAVLDQGRALYFDDNHLSVQGALFLKDDLARAFAPGLPPPVKKTDSTR